VSDNPAELAHRVAYLDILRTQGRGARTAGFIACLLGVLILVVGRFRLGGAVWLLWTGVVVVGFGWSCFVYALYRRLQWARAHPYDPNAPLSSGAPNAPQGRLG
jgi:cytosine/uracil/thiamine/allantoin permease